MSLIDDIDIQTLKKLGLTPLEAKVYLTVAKSRRSTMKAIAKNAQIDRAEAYRVIPELEKGGFVNRIIGTPNRYEAIPIADITSILLKSKKNEMSKLQNEINRLVTRHGYENKTTDEEELMIFIPKEESTINNPLEYEFERSIDVLTKADRARAANLDVEKKFKKALEKGVRIRVLVEKPNRGCPLPEPLKSLEQNPLYEERYTPYKVYTPFSISDGKKIFIVISQDANWGRGSAIQSNNTQLIGTMQDYFNQLWRKSKSTRSLQIKHL